jgi:hypothetical protein
MPRIQFVRVPLPHEIPAGVSPYRIGQVVEVPETSADRWRRRNAAVDAPSDALTDEEAAEKAAAEAKAIEEEAAAKAKADAEKAKEKEAADKAAAEAKAKRDSK